MNLVSQLVNLRELYLNDNLLSSLAPEIGRFRNLCKLTLNNNRFQYLPQELGQLSHLVDGSGCNDYQTLFTVDNNPLVSPPPEVVNQGTVAILAYLRNEAWWHLQRLIAGAASSVGLVAAIVLGFRWKRRRGKTKEKRS